MMAATSQSFLSKAPWLRDALISVDHHALRAQKHHIVVATLLIRVLIFPPSAVHAAIAARATSAMISPYSAIVCPGACRYP
jgi:hypothetical protein